MYKNIVLPIGCATSFLILQYFVHEETFQTLLSVVTWIFFLIIIQTLCLRQGFFHRFSIVSFVFGLLLLPYLVNMTPDSGYERFGLESVGLSNPNVLAEWFGFCAIFFLIVGLESKSGIFRTISWLSMLVCVFVITLTISRGTLLGVGIASTIALRHSLKRSFIPILILLIISWIAFLSGVLDTAITSYSARSTEESGRFITWPRAIDRFVTAPLEGVGISNIKTDVPSKGKAITPHNGFITLGLASGIVPLAFFVAYWMRAARGAFFVTAKQMKEAPFLLPLIIFAFQVNFGTNYAYMNYWFIVVLSLAIAAGNSRRIRRGIKYTHNKRLRYKKPSSLQGVGTQA